MSSSDIPAVPQFLLRETDQHVLQAMAADNQADEQLDGSADDDASAAPPATDLSSVNLFAEDRSEKSASPALEETIAAPVTPTPAASSIPKSAYSLSDLALFRTITGYRLDSRAPIWRAVDDRGSRVPIADRIFTTLAEEAFRLADRQRRSGPGSKPDLTIEDLLMVLSSIQRAAVSIGSRGLAAFERLEERVRQSKTEATGDTLPAFLSQKNPLDPTAASA